MTNHTVDPDAVKHGVEAFYGEQHLLSEDQGVIYDGPNILGTTGDTEYPTVIYTLFGEPRALSTLGFTNALRFAVKAKGWADSGVALIFTDNGWNI